MQFAHCCRKFNACEAELMSSTLLLIILTLSIGAAAWLLFLWAVKSGQYDDVEGPKYRMLDDDDDTPPPHSKTGTGR